MADGKAPGGADTRNDDRSVWQRALSVWRTAGLEWQNPAGWAVFDADLQRTEPIPVVPAAEDPPVTARAAPEHPSGADGDAGPASPVNGTEAGLGEEAPETGSAPESAAPAAAADTGLASAEDAAGAAALGVAAVAVETAAAAPGAVADRPAPSVPAAGAGTPEAAVEVGTPEPAAGAGTVEPTAEPAVPKPGPTAAEPATPGTEPVPTEPAPGPASSEPACAEAAPEPAPAEAAPEPAAAATRPAGEEPSPGIAGPGSGAGEPELAPEVPGRRHRAGRGVLVGAIVCVAVIALAISAIVVTGTGTGGGAGLTLTGQSAVPADGQFAGPGGMAWSAVPPALTGIAASGSTVVAIGARAGLPAAQPLMLTSADGGKTWRRDVLPLPAGAMAGASAVPLMVAAGRSGWLALAADATWTSTDGRSWRLGPAIAPVAAGDRVQALAVTATGFLAVGENIHLQGTEVTRSPVLWRTSDGLTWQREGAAQLRLPAGKGRVAGLHWLAAKGSAAMIAGDVARSVTTRRGKRRVTVTVQSVMVWLSTNGGRTWVKTDPPVSNGATGGLAGLAATGSGMVAVRPGHTTGGLPDAVAYLVTHGAAWRYAGRLRVRRGGFVVTAVRGSDNGAVVAGSAGARRLAFVTGGGRFWRRTANLATSPSAQVTGVTVGPHGNVVAAGAGSQPFLLLARAHQLPVGQAALAAAAAAGVSVNSLGASQGSQVAVGQAVGRPAIWLRRSGGQWTLQATPALAAWQGEGPGLTSVVHGSAGWLAIGTEGGPGPATPLASTGLLTIHAVGSHPQPVLLTSADGHSWQAQAGLGPAAPSTLTLTGAAAGPSGYVVVGLRSNGGQPVPAVFWSGDLRTWRPQGWWAGSAPAGQPVSAPLAVATGPAGFVAVGGIGSRPAVWLSRTGQAWVMRPLALPRGARGAVLQRVAIQGARIAALGSEARGSGPVPFAAVSADGGRTWREYLLPVPAHPAAVTALAATGRGFAATGSVTSPRGQYVITWWSADGRHWRLARPAGSGLSGPGEHAITALAGLRGQVTGVGYAATGAGQHLILWRAQLG